MREIKLRAQRATPTNDVTPDTMGNAAADQRDGIPKSTRSGMIIDTSNNTRPAPITQQLAAVSKVRAKLREVDRRTRAAEKQRKALTREYVQLAQREATLRAKLASDSLSGRRAGLVKAQLDRIAADKRSNASKRGNITRALPKLSGHRTGIVEKLYNEESTLRELREARKKPARRNTSVRDGVVSGETTAQVTPPIVTNGNVELIDAASPEFADAEIRDVYAGTEDYYEAAELVVQENLQREKYSQKQFSGMVHNVERTLQAADNKGFEVTYNGKKMSATLAITSGMYVNDAWSELARQFGVPMSDFPYKGMVR
jgi:hypothetical protein